MSAGHTTGGNPIGRDATAGGTTGGDLIGGGTR